MASGAASPLASLHTHSQYCDGNGAIAEYAERAAALGLAAFGASGHAPLPFPCPYALPLARLDEYCGEVRRLADAYRERLPIFLGLELDYLPGLSDFYAREIFARGLDYVIASVHYVGLADDEPWCYDEAEASFTARLQERHGGDARPIVEDYYRRVGEMIAEASAWNVPVVVGHLDRITLWNRDDRYFPTGDAWYAGLVDPILAAIARSGCILELNTSGWDKPAALPNPGPAILRRAAALDVPVILSADAHWPANVARHFERGLALLRESGFRQIVVPRADGWRRMTLAEE